ncbi:fluoride efflux transporter CrcB [Novosphingopyxis baekryungensis]|uniref:fluoride efflux transporter CrcB n=1 Tax=Novosphingopyxis baekryungensis TaxID=279369 RepID=UPI0003B48F03|nr:fluoride efflux transporter CrcB [Novosphingopyxis baekryungensis]
MNMLLVMAGGAIGAGLRYQLGRLALRLAGPDWPWGTFAANVLGGLAMGVLVGMLARIDAAEGVRLLLGIGLLGGFTTFSSFSLEVVTMIERGALIGAAGYALASVLLAVAALFGGLALVRNVAW